MRSHEHRNPPVRQPAQLSHDRRLGGGIEMGGGLIEQQHGRTGGLWPGHGENRSGERQPVPLPCGQAAAVVAQCRRQALLERLGRQAELRQDLFRLGLSIRGDGERLTDGPREGQSRALRDILRPRRPRMPRGGVLRTGEHTQQRRLTAARRAGQHHELT